MVSMDQCLLLLRPPRNQDLEKSRELPFGAAVLAMPPSLMNPAPGEECVGFLNSQAFHYYWPKSLNLVPGGPLPGYAELTLRNENTYAVSQPKEEIAGLWEDCVIGNLLQNFILIDAASLPPTPTPQMPNHFTWRQAPI